MQKGEKNCTQEIGTLMRAIVPAGSVMKIFNFVEAVPEKDIELIVRIPFFLKSSSYVTTL
jgi:hypothetical protein